MNEFDILQTAIDSATKHGKHNQKLHGRRGGDYAQSAMDFDAPAASGGGWVAPEVSPQDAAKLMTSSGDLSDANGPERWDQARLAAEKDAILQAYMDADYTDAERRAMDIYGSGYHNDLNGLLSGRPLRKQDPDDLREKIALMDSAMERARVPSPVVVYRGSNASPERLAQLSEIGNVISSPEFYSTSTDITTAGGFQKARPGKPHRVLMNITVPAGAKAVNMNVTTAPVKYHSINENELVLPRNTKMVVRGTRKEIVREFGEEYELTHVDLEVIVED